MTTKGLMGLAVFVASMSYASRAHAQISVGTWERTDAPGKGITMTAEVCCNGGRRLTYHVPAPGQPLMTLTVDSAMDGKDAPVLLGGKPSPETMAITRIDERHYRAVVKMNGQTNTTSSGTLSADGKTLTVESTSQSGKVVETWIRK